MKVSRGDVVCAVGGGHGEIWDSAADPVRRGSGRGYSTNQRLQEATYREDLLCPSHRRGLPLHLSAHAPPMTGRWTRWRPGVSRRQGH